jgi:hypothetical protein
LRHFILTFVPNLKRVTEVRGKPVFIVAFLLIVLSAGGFAQESIRPSLTGVQASEMRKPTTAGEYNLKLGQVQVDLTSSVEIEANDNINLSEVNRQSDLIIRPSIQAHSFWQVTRTNALHLDLGIGYAKYLNNSRVDTSSLLISPDSQLSFDIFVGDFKINLHDRFTILQNPIDDISLSQVAKFDRVQNSAGISVLWDLNDIKLVFGYDHFTFRALSGEFDYLNRSEEQFSFSASAALDSTTTVGLDANAAPINYQQQFNNDGLSYSVGPFLEKQVSNYLKLRLSGGYQGMAFSSGGGNGDTSNQNSYYVDLNIAHRMNTYWTESLSIGHETRLSLETNFVAYTYLRYAATWQVNHKLALSMNAFYEDADESASTRTSEHAQRYGVGISTTYRINRKLSMGLRYGYTNKNSDIALRSYYQDSTAICLTYDF